MKERRHYSKAPITEAIIDFRLSLPVETSLDDLRDLLPEIQADYLHQEEYSIWEQQIAVGESNSIPPTQKNLGYIYSTSDRKQVLIAATNGFTFSRLAPYDRWETFRDEAQRLWKIYRSNIEISAITRVGTRYVNRIDIPLPITELKHFLRTLPEVPSDLSQELSGYFMQLQIPQEDIQATIVLNQAIIPSSNPNVISILLDIDVSKENNLFLEGDFWEHLEVLHTKLDSVFESCITDAVRELIK
jgi:uncharacterized protein (TIGR04255 family)